LVTISRIVLLSSTVRIFGFMENQWSVLPNSKVLPGFLEWKVSQQPFRPRLLSSGIGHRIGLEKHKSRR
jgi:hypothetical protein